MESAKTPSAPCQVLPSVSALAKSLAKAPLTAPQPSLMHHFLREALHLQSAYEFKDEARSRP